MSHATRQNTLYLFILICSIAAFSLYPTAIVMARSPGQDSLDRGTLLYKEGDFQKARDAFNEATKQDPALIKAWENLGWAHYKTGNSKEALKIWTMLLKVEPQNADVLNALGVYYLETENWEPSIKWFSKALRADPSRDTVRLKYGDAYEGAKKWNQAISQYKQILENHPHDLQALHRLVRVYERSGNITKGIETLNQYLSGISVKDTQSEYKLARLYAKQGNLFYGKKKYQQAANAYKTALKWRPAYPQYLKNLGWSYWHLSQWKSCEKIWLSYANKFPNNKEPQNLLTRLYMRLGRHQKALASISRSLELDANQPDEQLNRARALFASQQYKAAKTLSGRLSKRYPKHLAINTFWGEILMQYHDFKRGQKQWRKVLNLGSDSPRAYYYWLKSQYEEGNYAAAVEKAQKYLKKNGPNRHILEFLRDDALAQNDIKTAIIYASQMLDYPEIAKNPRSWLDLAELYKETFQYAEAKQVLNDALAHHPENTAIQIKLADLNRVQRNYIKALGMFTELYDRHPYNFHAFAGVFTSLNGIQQYGKALNHIKRNERSFFKEYDLATKKARLETLLRKDGAPYPKASYSAIYIPMLLYHGLNKREQSRNLSVKLFDDQLHALQKAGYTTITVQELEKMVDQYAPFPEKPILITFDDARRDSFQLADPVLKRYSMKATMFVPTSKTVPDHPFFADWDTIGQYRRTNRWDIQSHGHEAHEPIDIDGHGNKGFFLSNYQWLPYQQRNETDDEFNKRLSNDYRVNVKILKQQFPNDSIIGYAFPYSEAGQESGGNVQDAWKINEADFDRYFRFGFIQDTNGYNRIVPGDRQPKFLRRVGVAHNWNGAQLLRHLISQHPVNQEKLEQAKPYNQRGSYTKSKALLYKLRDEEPLMDEEVRYQLSSVAYQQALYREAERHLTGDDGSFDMVHTSAREVNLHNKILWWNRPRLGLKFRYFSDSDDRDNTYWSARFNYPLRGPVDIWAEPGFVEFNQKGEPSLDGTKMTIGVDWRATEMFHVSTSGRLRMMDGSDNTVNGWLSTRYGTNNQHVKLRIGREDIDTLEARQADILTNSFAGNYFGRFYDLWRVNLAAAHREYTDDNSRNDFRFDWRYELPTIPYWQVGFDVGYSDTERDVELYYSPQELIGINLNVFYQRIFDADWALNVKLGLGAGKETDESTQPGGRFHLDLNKVWHHRWRGHMAFDYAQTPSYDSAAISAGLTFRF